MDCEQVNGIMTVTEADFILYGVATITVFLLTVTAIVNLVYSYLLRNKPFGDHHDEDWSHFSDSLARRQKIHEVAKSKSPELVT